jgi:hypothetical protein
MSKKQREPEDAKAQSGELVPHAGHDEPQTVTVGDREAVVSLGADRLPLVDFLKGLELGGLDLTREPDFGRNGEL